MIFPTLDSIYCHTPAVGSLQESQPNNSPDSELDADFSVFLSVSGRIYCNVIVAALIVSINCNIGSISCLPIPARSPGSWTGENDADCSQPSAGRPQETDHWLDPHQPYQDQIASCRCRLSKLWKIAFWRKEKLNKINCRKQTPTQFWRQLDFY